MKRRDLLKFLGLGLGAAAAPAAALAAARTAPRGPAEPPAIAPQPEPAPSAPAISGDGEYDAASLSALLQRCAALRDNIDNFSRYQRYANQGLPIQFLFKPEVPSKVASARYWQHQADSYKDWIERDAKFLGYSTEWPKPCPLVGVIGTESDSRKITAPSFHPLSENCEATQGTIVTKKSASGKWASSPNPSDTKWGSCHSTPIREM